MKKNAVYTGLTGVAIRGFFTNLQDKIVQKKVVDVQLKPNGRISPVHLCGWANSRGFVTETLPSGVIRIGHKKVAPSPG